MNNGTNQFAGTVAVVTGAGSGIGRATARLLAQLGAKVHCADLDAQSAERVAHDIGTAVAHQRTTRSTRSGARSSPGSACRPAPTWRPITTPAP